jgi:hypothetical protein
LEVVFRNSYYPLSHDTDLRSQVAVSPVDTVVDQLETELESFRATLNKDLKKTFRSTTSDRFKSFLQPQGIAGRLEAISNVFERLCELSKDVDVLDQELLQSLFGTVQCTLMVGHNKHKDMKPVVEFLDTVGKVALPSCSRKADRDDLEGVWSALVAICYEVVKWCNIFVTEGLTYRCSRNLALD